MLDKVTFIAPAFNEQRFNRPLLESLLNQTNSNWELIVYHNGVSEEMRQWVLSYNDDRITYKESTINTGYWGCYNRIDALNNFLNTKYVIQTSIQDYYINNAVQVILDTMEGKNIDICNWNSIYPARQPEVFDTQLKTCEIDWGNFCMLSSIAKQLGIPEPDKITADGITIETGIQRGLFSNRVKIDQVLTVKN